MSFSYDRYERRGGSHRDGRSVLGYWVPLGLTVLAAGMTIAAWVWSERSEEDDNEDGEKRRNGSGAAGDDPMAQGRGDDQGPDGPLSRDAGPPGSEAGSASVMARMSGAIRRTPSPQQIFDQASRRVAAGVAAAGAAVEGALSSIREEERDDFGDHSRWSEEAEMKPEGPGAPAGPTSLAGAAGPSSSHGPAAETTERGAPLAQSSAAARRYAPGKRKSVAIVVSGEASEHLSGELGDGEVDASVLSHLPPHIDHATTQLFILIAAPSLKQHPLAASTPARPGGSVTSSYSNIAHDDARTPGDEPDRMLTALEPEPVGGPSSSDSQALGTLDHRSASSSFRAVYTHARSLVETDTMVLPFTTPSGHVHILRHLAPEIVYVQESLTGHEGDVVTHISGWVGQVIVVVGAEGGHGGLVDSEDEGAPGTDQTVQWWQQGDRVGLGKGIDIVDGMRIEEDWRRRVGGRE